MKRCTERVHEVLRRHVVAGDVVVDATLGNGHDCRFLASLVGASGRVYAFDVDSDAVATATARSREDPTHDVIVVHACHTELRAQIDAQDHGKLRAVVFNLGYRPGSDRSRTTQSATTIAALDAALALLADEGILSVVAYSGHSGGQDEAQAVAHYFARLQSCGALTVLEADAESGLRPRIFIGVKRGQRAAAVIEDPGPGSDHVA